VSNNNVDFHRGFGLELAVHCIKSAMSNRNGLLVQKLCHHLNEGCTLNDTLMKAAH